MGPSTGSIPKLCPSAVGHSTSSRITVSMLQWEHYQSCYVCGESPTGAEQSPGTFGSLTSPSAVLLPRKPDSRWIINSCWAGKPNCVRQLFPPPPQTCANGCLAATDWNYARSHHEAAGAWSRNKERLCVLVHYNLPGVRNHAQSDLSICNS